jgi:hypothetical protein
MQSRNIFWFAKRSLFNELQVITAQSASEIQEPALYIRTYVRTLERFSKKKKIFSFSKRTRLLVASSLFTALAL